MIYREAYEKGKSIIVSAEPEQDTLILLEYVMGTDRNDLFLHPDREIDPASQKRFFEFIERRNTGEPVQYITGRTFFYGLEFKCRKGVLIPRFDTEILVEEVLKKVKEGSRVLDMCTGTGCIALSIKNMRKDLDVAGSDIDDTALETAMENRDNLSLDVNFVKSNLFENIEGKFDCLVSNPPYIERNVIKSLESTVKDFEPERALDGGEDGLDFYRKIIKDAKEYLNENAFIFFEIGYDQGKSVPDILSENGYKDIKVIKDLNGLDRVVHAVFGG
ncbi:MAG: peptide chain release factor N(5)-glutamine methyltransferase [Lachnospiraceae bacterium]|nr:peptide chain release factor N(5)-glutamine methyltransferase [Lachnospiraceae bacterium]